MKGLKVLCLILTIANLGVMGTIVTPNASEGLRAVVPSRSRGTTPALSGGKPVLFRSFEDRVTVTLSEPSGPAVGVPSEALDGSSIAYLGQMKGTRSETVYFLKDTRVNRVFTAGDPNSPAKILSQNDTNMVIEIDGTKYSVSR